MQERFVQAIAKMNEAITKPEANADTEELLLELESSIHDGEITEQLFQVQEKKAALMVELQSALHQLEEEETVGEEGRMRRVEYDTYADQLIIFGRGGVKETISRGQLLVAGLWDEEYFLDTSVPRELKKQYLTHKTRYQIADLYDEQIALFEGHQAYNKNSGFEDAYQAIVARYEPGAEQSPGILAEKMVESFITKLTHDYDMPYRLKSVTVYEDVEYKIDFIIEPLTTNEPLGVGVAEPESRTDIAIQFTTAKSPVTIEHKHKQVNRAQGNINRDDSLHVKNLLLVVLPIKHVVDIFDTWQNTKPGKRIPGGPDELWETEDKEQIFRGLLDKIFTTEQLDNAWGQVANQGV